MQKYKECLHKSYPKCWKKNQPFFNQRILVIALCLPDFFLNVNLYFLMANIVLIASLK